MKLYSNVYEVKTVCHVQKIALPFLVSELLPFNFFLTIFMHAITK